MMERGVTGVDAALTEGEVPVETAEIETLED